MNVKASHNSLQVQHVYESYVLLEKHPTFSDAQRYDFDYLLKRNLTRDNTFAQIRPYGKDVYKVEKSKEDNWQPRTFRSRN